MDIKILRAKQDELKKLQEEIKGEKQRIADANAKYFTALTASPGAKQALAALHAQAVELNQPDITLSGNVEGIEGTVSLRVRLGDVLNANR